MEDLLRTGSDWLEDMRHQHATQTVTYRRGAESVQLQATVGQTTFDVETAGGVVERFESRDFLVRAQDLVLAGQRTMPQPRDTIEESADLPTGQAGEKVMVYGVMAPGAEPVWRYSDPGRATVRIHTKLLETKE